jgi:hypothetical protein
MEIKYEGWLQVLCPSRSMKHSWKNLAHMSMSYSMGSKLLHLFYVFFLACEPILIFQVHL